MAISFTESSVNLVFIDPTIPDYQSLLAGADSTDEIVILDPTQDGIVQITEALVGRSVNSIHIVSHGTAGSIQLGTAHVDSASIQTTYNAALQQWTDSLLPGGDILLYGCNVAQGEAGLAFVQQFSQLTGADIAASDNATGSLVLGGDWNLEVATGTIEAPLAFQASVLEAYNSVLAPFTAGDIIVLRTGDGSAALSSAATAVFLDEYNLAGTRVQSIALPTTVSGTNGRLTQSGTAGSEGALTLSADGRYLTLVGYDAALGTASVASTTSANNNRIVARVDASGSVDTSTRLTTTYSGNNIRSAVTNDGSGFWVAGPSTGLTYVPFGSTGVSTTLNGLNSRVVNIFNGQLYDSSQSGSNIGVNTVGTGLPTSGTQTVSLLPGLPNAGNPYAYVLLDRDPDVAGLDTLYIADQSASSSGGGLLKYSFNGTTWTARGSIAGTLTGLTGAINSSGGVDLFGTNGTSAGNTLFRFTDSTAFDANLSGSFTTLATAGANTVFRGVAFAPTTAAPVLPDLTLSQSDAPDPVVVGNTLTYTLTVGNSGNASASNITVQYTLPNGVTFNGTTVSNGFTASQSGNLITFSGGSINAGNTATLAIAVTPTTAGTLNSGTGVVDPNNTIAESNETNNTAAAITTTVQAAGNTAPTIQLNTAATTNFLDGGAANALPVTGIGYISGVINDPTDPASQQGLVFTINDAETAASGLTVTATSSNSAVVSNGNLLVSGTGSDRTLKILPSGVGYADITVTVSDGSLINSYAVKYAASAASTVPSTSRFLTGASNASTAIAIDASYMLVGDDENQALRLYDRTNSGLPINSFDYTSSLGLTDLSGGVPREVDIEASAQVGNRIFWMGSQSNNDSGSNRPNRDRVFATDISGTGASTTLSYVGRYDFLREDIIGWDVNNGHGKGANYYGLAASAAAGVSSKINTGYNIEGLEFAPDNSTAYVAFRAPQEPTGTLSKALIVPVTNFTTLLSASGGTQGTATFGAPIELDLGGRGIREIRKNASNQYVIIAGPAGDATGVAPADFQLYTWTGVVNDAPVLRSTNLTALNADGGFESIVEVPSNLTNTSQLQLLVDNGNTVYYNDGAIAKDVNANFQKSRSEIVTLGAAVQTTPTVTITANPDSTTEGSTISGLFTISRTGDTTNPLTVNFTTGGTATSGSDYLTPASFATNSIVIPAGSSSATIAITPIDDNIVEPVESAIITLSSSSNYTLGSTSSATVTINDNDFIKIHDIQGSGSTFNPAYGGTQTIEGIVVSAFLGSTKLNGFYVEEEDADWDNDPTTSEGLFVFDPTGLFSGNVGDKVRVTGTVAEFTSSASGITGRTINSSLTQISLASTVATKSVLNLGASALPSVVNVTLPVADPSVLERYEGMLVNLKAATGPLTVTDTFGLGRYGQVGLSADGRLIQYTQVNAPSVAGYSDYVANLLDNYIILDDGSTRQNPDPEIFARGGQPLSATNTLRGGDTIASITGILDQRFEGYRVQTITPADFQATNPRPLTAPDVGGTLRVADANLLNYFTDLNTGAVITIPNGVSFQPRGANTATEFTRQRDKAVASLLSLNADVIGVQEIENDGTKSLQNLVDGLNAIAGAGTYAFINDTNLVNDPNSAPNAVGTDAIKVGILYKPGKVTPVGLPSTYLEPNPSNPIFSRPPIAQTFVDSNNGTFTVIMNHFKSKGSTGATGADLDQGDGQGAFNAKRVAQANALLSFIDTVKTTSGDNDVLVIGDLNSYAKEDPITTLTNGGLTNLFNPSSYSYQFSGQWGSLDYGLASSSLLAQVTGAEKYHNNSDEPVVLDYNTEFKSANQVNSFYAPDQYRASDHDPLVIGLNLRPTNRFPVAVNDTVNTNEDTAVTFNSLVNDSDPDNDTLTITQVNGSAVTVINPLTLASGALLTLNPDNTFSYNPNGKFETLPSGQSAADSFTYTISDGKGGTATATVNVAIAGVNDPASISGTATGSVTEDLAVVNGKLAATGVLTVADVDTGENKFNPTVTSPNGNLGSLTIGDTGTWNYSVDNSLVQYLGTGQTKNETFTVKSFDGTASQDIVITIAGVNDAPIGTPAAILSPGTEDTLYIIKGTDLLTGFTDVDGDTLAVASLSANNGTLGAYNATNGTWNFTPTADYNGTVNLNYSVVDGNGGSILATQSFNLAAVNDAPINTVPGSQTAVQDGVLIFSAANGNAIAISDVDANGGQERVKLSVTNGFLNLSSNNGLTIVNGSNNSAAITVQGNLDALNNVLSGLKFTPDALAVINGSVTLTILTDDLGNTGAGGAKTDTDMVAIAIKPANLIRGGAGNNTLQGTVGADTIYGGAGNNKLYGNGGNDIIFGGDDNDEIYGGAGNDYINGGNGNDLIYAYGGNNTIYGGAGNDTIYVGNGINFIDGGLGSDTIYLNGGQDTIVLARGNGIDTINGYSAGSTRFNLSAGLMFNNLSFTQDGKNTLIQAGTEKLASLVGVTASSISASNFMSV